MSWTKKQTIAYHIRTLWGLTGVGHPTAYYGWIHDYLLFECPSFLVDSVKREIELIKQFPYAVKHAN